MSNQPTLTQIQKIVGLESSELTSLLQSLLGKKGFSDIQLFEDCIFATQNALLKKSSAVFITFPFKLGGKKFDYAEIANNIRAVQGKHAANNVYIYSNNFISKGFQSSINSELISIQITYIGRDELIGLIDEVFPEYWRHDDIQLLKYEKDYMSFVSQDSDLKRLKFPDDKYSKLLNIFIEPQLVRYYQDSKTGAPLSKSYSVDELIEHDGSLVLEGMAGAGKSTLLKKIGVKLIEKNTLASNNKKYLPVFLTALDIFTENCCVLNALMKRLSSLSEASLYELVNEYDIHLMIDSIDEFSGQQPALLNELKEIDAKYGIKYYVATRNGDNLLSQSTNGLSSFSIRKFNFSQIKLFLDKFFSGDEGKSSALLDALRDNKMLDRLPITPLTLSLISILFEETDFEIPATISDIYDNFNTLIIGKAVVSSKIEFIDISFKERILSIYALELLKTPAHLPFKKAKFIDFFRQYFEGKSLPIKKGSLEDVLEYLIQNTGILFLKDDESVQFTHDSYMEYYAALEIFKHQRNLEKYLVDYFFDPNWQNAAVFYAGESKDMPDFLQMIKSKMSSASNVSDFMSGILGGGNLLQALYQTDNVLRKQIVLVALELSLKNLDIFKMMAADEVKLFRNYRLPILTLINFVFFYESYNSITLAEPLRMAFRELYQTFDSGGKTDMSLGYQLLELAFTLDSKRIADQSALATIMDTPELLKDPNLNILASISLDLLRKNGYQAFRDELKKIGHSLSTVQSDLVKLPMAKLRFSALDTIHAPSKVKLFTEGKTDALIIEYAFMMLSGGRFPYWQISKAGGNEERGSCVELKKTLEQSFAFWRGETDSTIIGIFDHDSAGLSSYRGLNSDFVELERDKIKKHKDGNIFAVCLPVPGELEAYLQQKQEFNFFELEHYMGIDYLENAKVLKQTPIHNVYEISGDKMKLASRIRKEQSPALFRNFQILLELIDSIANVEVDYTI